MNCLLVARADLLRGGDALFIELALYELASSGIDVDGVLVRHADAVDAEEVRVAVVARGTVFAKPGKLAWLNPGRLTSAEEQRARDEDEQKEK